MRSSLQVPLSIRTQSLWDHPFMQFVATKTVVILAVAIIWRPSWIVLALPGAHYTVRTAGFKQYQQLFFQMLSPIFLKLGMNNPEFNKVKYDKQLNPCSETFASRLISVHLVETKRIVLREESSY
ncbi:hypothetical protein EW146_g5068 [Bondarzewia mesenterica]|uniref:Uncharacterized protein n=1 Tax=Bondarzewia mesenterica TaxID=1095465 RepID=A0A4S4LSK3_9AGAM|nr:hypothetical protein EW146_g5068 [Bondarzewia mesenterica]